MSYTADEVTGGDIERVSTPLRPLAGLTFDSLRDQDADEDDLVLNISGDDISHDMDGSENKNNCKDEEDSDVDDLKVHVITTHADAQSIAARTALRAAQIAAAGNDIDSPLFVPSMPLLETDTAPTSELKQPSRSSFFNVCAWERETKVKFVALIVFFAVVVTCFFVFHIPMRFLQLVDWVRKDQVKGAVAMVGLTACSNLLMLPGSLAWLAAGFAFRPLPVAFLVAWVSSIVGLSLAFCVARYLFRPCIEVELQSRPEAAMIDVIMGQRSSGFRLVLLLRVALMPYNVGNYIFGVTSVAFWDYLLGSAVGIIPPLASMTYFGSMAKSVHEISTGAVGPGKTETILGAILASAGLAISAWYITTRARQMVADELQKARERD
jgi:uncharacterized membrane protein YdjX (TVP38/TMEM64 family)